MFRILTVKYRRIDCKRFEKRYIWNVDSMKIFYAWMENNSKSKHLCQKKKKNSNMF